MSYPRCGAVFDLDHNKEESRPTKEEKRSRSRIYNVVVCPPAIGHSPILCSSFKAVFSYISYLPSKWINDKAGMPTEEGKELVGSAFGDGVKHSKDFKMQYWSIVTCIFSKSQILIRQELHVGIDDWLTCVSDGLISGVFDSWRNAAEQQSFSLLLCFFLLQAWYCQCYACQYKRSSPRG